MHRRINSILIAGRFGSIGLCQLHTKLVVNRIRRASFKNRNQQHKVMQEAKDIIMA